MISPPKNNSPPCQIRYNTDEEIRIKEFGKIKENKEITQLKNEIVRINSFTQLYRNNSDTNTAEGPADQVM